MDFALLGKKAHEDCNGFGRGNIPAVGRVGLDEPNPSNLGPQEDFRSRVA